MRTAQNGPTTFQTNMDPGPDRVVFTGLGTFVGVFTHRGERNNRFHQALGHTEPVFDPEPQYDPFGPTGMDRDPLPWLLGGTMGSSGNVPFKRDVSSSAPAPTPIGTPCQGNQVTGDCVQATFPKKPDNSGPQAPICIKYNDSNKPRINEQKTKDGVTTYCQNLINDKVKLTPSSTAPGKAGIVSGGAENGGDIAISVLYWPQACDSGSSSVDFGSMSLDTCFQNFYPTIDQFCGQDSTWGQAFNPDAQLEGGMWGTGCAMWSIYGQSHS